MLTQCEAIIKAFRTLGGAHAKKEISEWAQQNMDKNEKNGTTMVDMISISYGGNQSSSVPSEFWVLKRVSKGRYALINQD